jgi:hypothetical protein
MYHFLAKQGQHNQIAVVLRDNIGKPRMRKYSGPRGEGVLISIALPQGMSKRYVDRLLHSKSVPGSVSRRNKYRVFKFADGWVDHYEIVNKIGTNVMCVIVNGRKMIRGMVDYYNFGCDCCGGYYRVLDRNGNEVSQ